MNGWEALTRRIAGLGGQPQAPAPLPAHMQSWPSIPADTVVGPEPGRPAQPRDTNYYFGPHAASAVNGLLGLARAVGPQADMQGMVDSSADTMNALRAGDWLGSLANLGLTAAAPLGVFIPGTTRGYKDAAQNIITPRASESGRMMPLAKEGSDVPHGQPRSADGDRARAVSAPESAPGGQGAGGGGPVFDPEGRSLADSRVIVGKRHPEGPDEPLSAEAALGALSRLTRYSEVPKSKLKSGVVGAWNPGDGVGGGEIAVWSGLGPTAKIRTQIHEGVHEVDRLQAQAAIDAMKRPAQNALMREMRLVSQEVRPQDWTRGANPRLMPGRPTAESAYADNIGEHLARVGEVYAIDPERAKAAYPLATAFFRRIWNETDRARREIGFNQLAAPVAAGALGAATFGFGSEDGT